MASSPRPHALEIASTWDGCPLPPEAVSRVSLGLGRGVLTVTVEAPFYDDPPPVMPDSRVNPAAPGPTWKLWEHEVVEVFIAGPGERYTEIELGPWGHYLVLRLEGRRNVVERVGQLDVAVTREAGRWRAEAHLDAACLPSGPHTLNAYAIHGLGDRRCYAAAYPATRAHPAPDFHRLETFQPWAESGRD